MTELLSKLLWITWLAGGVQVLLQEGHGVDLLRLSGGVQVLHNRKLPGAAAQLVQPRSEVKPAGI